jgi:hypothetical protein
MTPDELTTVTTSKYSPMAKFCSRHGSAVPTFAKAHATTKVTSSQN